ncbi:hypothetical protein LPJ53_002579 [Coemansia erecta]|uniref:Rad60/SUMO-like domain-containing protein n=1 Tax=Coemansia erecta TaxID=147472 RepID=A0A9W7Y305_9FUNG|nr:hypothetical protein LPJ53_002579 [Coemansia erecta]
MSAVSSDSEVEVVPSPPKITPRAVRRPLPARSSHDNDGGSSSSDSDDDVSFFTYRRPPVTLADLPEPNASGERAAEGKNGNVEPLHGPRGAFSDSSDSGNVVDSSDSDSEVEEVNGSEAHSGGRGRGRGGGAKRRRHSGGSDDDSGAEGQSKRSRSVSVTPPPDTSVRPAPRAPIRNMLARAFPAEPISVPESTDTSDLDPSLLAAITAASTPGATDPALAEKVQVEFQLVYDEQFLSADVPLTWDSKRWGRVKPHESQKILKKLNERVAVVVFASDPVAKALQVFSDNFPVDVAATDPVLVQSAATRVFLTSRVASLGKAPVHYVRVFPRSVYGRVKAHEALVSRQREAEREEMSRDMEIARELRRNVGADEVEVVDEEQQQQEEGPPEGAIRIKIRNKEGKDQLLMVMPTTTVQSVIDNYRKMAGLAEDAAVRLEFDDEKLDPASTIGETEIEDDDMLTVF